MSAPKARSPPVSEIAVRRNKSPAISEIVESPRKRKARGVASAPIGIEFDSTALGKVFQYSAFEVPDHFSGFGKVFKGLNTELYSVHSDSSLPSEIKLALDAGVSSFNRLLSADATEISKLHASKQYIASLRVSDHYEKKAGKFLESARKRDLPGMIETAGAMGINLPNLLYKKGVYIKLGRRKQK